MVQDISLIYRSNNIRTLSWSLGIHRTHHRDFVEDHNGVTSQGVLYLLILVKSK
jgi:ribosomal protein L30/L7E